MHLRSDGIFTFPGRRFAGVVAVDLTWGYGGLGDHGDATPLRLWGMIQRGEVNWSNVQSKKKNI